MSRSPARHTLTRRQLLKGGLAAGAVVAGFPASAFARDGVAVRAAAAAAARRFTGAGGQWVEGDSHVHTDHSSDGSFTRQQSSHRLPGNVSVADQIGYAEARGLDYLPLTDHRTHAQHYNPQWESDQVLLITGEEANSRPHVLIHGAVDMVVQGADPPDDPGFRYLQQQVWDAHAQAAVYGSAHPERDWSDGWPGAGVPLARGNTVDIDFIEVWNRSQWPNRALEYAETLMNRGYRFAFVGGSDNHFRETWGVQGAGEPRTSTLVDGDLTERALLDAVRAGHTRVRNDDVSPDLDFRADFTGAGTFPTAAGDEVFAPTGTAGRLRVQVSPAIPGDVVRIYKSPGQEAGPLAELPVLAEMPDAEFVVDVQAEAEPTWYRVEVVGHGIPDSAQGLDIEAFTVGNVQRMLSGDQLRAIASPIFVSEGPVDPQPELPLPQDQGTDDGAAHVLGAPGAFAGFPSVVVAGGATHVVAEVHDAGATTIGYRRQGEGGQWTEPVDLTPDSRSARFPRVAAQGHDVWVVWQDERAGQTPRRSAVYARHSSDGGATWDPERVVRAPDGRAWRPALALTPDGQPVVAWAEIAQDRPFDVWVQVLDTDDEPHNLSGPGKEFHPQRPDDSRSARWPTSIHPAVAVAEDGTIAVAWQDNRDDPDPLFSGGPAEPPYTEEADGTHPDIWNIHLVERAAGSTGWGEPEIVGAADRVDVDPALAWAGDGTLVLAWNSRPKQAAGVNFEIQAAHRAPGGWSDPAVVAPAPEFMGQRPQLGLDPDGSVRIAWYDTRSVDWRWRVMTARLHDGQWADATMLNGPGNNTWPAVAGGRIAFVSTRNAERLQRDHTHEVFLVDTAPG